MVQITPSPGQYESGVPDQIESRVIRRVVHPAFKSKEIRDSLTNFQPNPGPAAYYAKVPVLGARKGLDGTMQVGQGFPKAVRFSATNYVGMDKINDAPGPDSYGFATAETRTVGGSVGRSLRFEKTPPKAVPREEEMDEPMKCTLIHPSANVKFDPSQQAHVKFEGV
jgi:hypothetical protein